MIVSISTVTTCAILGSLILWIACVLLQQGRWVERAGPKCLIAVAVAAVVRMFFPIEWGYTYSIRITKVLTTLRIILLHTVICKIEVWHILVGIWAAGSLVLGRKKIGIYKESRRVLRNFTLLFGDEEEIQWRPEFRERFPEVGKLRIVKLPLKNAPFLFGVRKPVVVLPEEEYTQGELEYIVGHEVMHYRNHDVPLKLLIEFLQILYWWNPLLRRLENRIFEMIEIKNDLEITRDMPRAYKIEYMECLKEVAVKQSKCARGGADPGTLGFSRKNLKTLLRRMELIDSQIQPKKMHKIAVGLGMAVLLFLSTAVVFEPEFQLPPETAGVVLTGDTGFLVENGELYDIYLLGEYMETTEVGEDMRPYRTLKIYKSAEEGLEHESEKYGGKTLEDYS